MNQVPLLIIIAFTLLAIILLIKFSIDINYENYKLRKRVKELDKELKYEIELKIMYESAYNELKAK